jgi:hypothetical protein
MFRFGTVKSAFISAPSLPFMEGKLAAGEQGGGVRIKLSLR